MHKELFSGMLGPSIFVEGTNSPSVRSRSLSVERSKANSVAMKKTSKVNSALTPKSVLYFPQLFTLLWPGNRFQKTKWFVRPAPCWARLVPCELSRAPPALGSISKSASIPTSPNQQVLGPWGCRCLLYRCPLWEIQVALWLVRMDVSCWLLHMHVLVSAHARVSWCTCRCHVTSASCFGESLMMVVLQHIYSFYVVTEGKSMLYMVFYISYWFIHFP